MRWTINRLAALTLVAGTTAAATAQAPAPSKPVALPSGSPPVVVQFPSGGPGGPGGGDRPRFTPGQMPDADTMWGFMSPGSDVIDVNKKPEMRGRLERWRITIPPNGIVTKAAFKAAFEKRNAEREAERAARGESSPGAAPVFVEQPQPVPQQPQPGQPPPGGDGKKKDDDREKPFVVRHGNLPKEVPSWFAEDDEDEDAMVGLYEWRRKKKSIAEFVKMDLNGDGMLTPDEYIRFKNAEIAKTPDGKGKDAGNRDRREARSGKPDDKRSDDRRPPGSPRGQRSDTPAAAPSAPSGERPKNPFTGK